MTKLTRQKRFLTKLLNIIFVIGNDVWEKNFERNFPAEIVLESSIYGTKTAKTDTVNDCVPIDKAIP
jgi:hypothetical protein